MNRLNFLKNCAGAFAATVIGSKLKLLDVPIHELLNDSTVVGIEYRTFQVTVQREWFNSFDLIMGEDNLIYYVMRISKDKLYAYCTDVPDLRIELEEVDLHLLDNQKPKFLKIQTACNENSTNT